MSTHIICTLLDCLGPRPPSAKIMAFTVLELLSITFCYWLSTATVVRDFQSYNCNLSWSVRVYLPKGGFSLRHFPSSLVKAKVAFCKAYISKFVLVKELFDSQSSALNFIIAFRQNSDTSNIVNFVTMTNNLFPKENNFSQTSKVLETLQRTVRRPINLFIGPLKCFCDVTSQGKLRTNEL